MWKYRYTFDYTFDYVKSKRPCIDINLGFLSQLKKWEQIIMFKEKSYIIGIDYYKNMRVFEGLVSLSDVMNCNVLLFHTENKEFMDEIISEEAENSDKFNFMSNTTFNIRPTIKRLNRIIIPDDTNSMSLDYNNFRSNSSLENEIIIKLVEKECLNSIEGDVIVPKSSLIPFLESNPVFDNKELYNCFFLKKP